MDYDIKHNYTPHQLELLKLLPTITNAIEYYTIICKIYETKPLPEIVNFLGNNIFIFDVSLINKDRNLKSILELLSNYKYFNEIRIRCSENRSVLYHYSLETSINKAYVRDIALMKNKNKMKSLQINSRILKSLSSAIKNNEHLELLELDSLEFSSYEPLCATLSNSHISKLYIRNCNLGNEGLRILVASLKNVQLLHFQVAACLLTSESGKYISRLFTHDRLRVEQEVWAHSLRCHNINHEHERIEQCERTKEFNALKEGLVWCDVSFNKIGNGIQELLNGLTDDSPLLILDLRNNEIEIKGKDDVSKQLISILQNNSTIQHIDFRNNVMPEDLKNLASALLIRNRNRCVNALERLSASAPPPVLVKLPPNYGQSFNQVKQPEATKNQMATKLDKNRPSSGSVLQSKPKVPIILGKKETVPKVPKKIIKMVPAPRRTPAVHSAANSIVHSVKGRDQSVLLDSILQQLKDNAAIQVKAEARIACLEEKNRELLHKLKDQKKEGQSIKKETQTPQKNSPTLQKKSTSSVKKSSSKKKKSLEKEEMNNLMGSLTDAVSRLYQILSDVESETFESFTAKVNEANSKIKDVTSKSLMYSPQKHRVHKSIVAPQAIIASADSENEDIPSNAFELVHERPVEDRIDALSIRLNALSNHMNQMEEINNQIVDEIGNNNPDYSIPYERVTDSLCDDDSDFEESEIDSIDYNENDSNDGDYE